MPDPSTSGMDLNAPTGLTGLNLNAILSALGIGGQRDLENEATALFGGDIGSQTFSSLMAKAGALRQNDPQLASWIDRYAQGKNVADQPGFNALTDIPMNAALATGYEGVKSLPEMLGNPILSAMGYGRKTTGSQPTAPASMDNVVALLRGILASPPPNQNVAQGGLPDMLSTQFFGL